MRKQDNKLGPVTIYAFFLQTAEKMHALDELVLSYQRYHWLNTSPIGVALEIETERLKKRLIEQIDREEASPQSEQLRNLIALLDSSDEFRPESLPGNLKPEIEYLASRALELLQRRAARNELQKADREGRMTWSWQPGSALLDELVEYCNYAHPPKKVKLKTSQGSGESELSSDAISEMRAKGWSEQEIARTVAMLQARKQLSWKSPPPPEKDIESDVCNELKKLICDLAAQGKLIVDTFLQPFKQKYISTCWEGLETIAKGNNKYQPIIDYSQRIARDLETDSSIVLLPIAQRLLGESKIIYETGGERILSPEPQLAQILSFISLPEAEAYFAYKYWSPKDKSKYDREKAFKWALKASFNGDGLAQVLLGKMCLLREPTSDQAEARYWFRKAYDQGSLEAGYLYVAHTIASIDSMDGAHHEASHKLLPFLGQAGNPESQCLLGENLASGNKNDEAVVWFRKSANQGFGKARMILERYELTGSLETVYVEHTESGLQRLRKMTQKADPQSIYFALKSYRNLRVIQSGKVIAAELFDYLTPLLSMNSTMLDFEAGLLLDVLGRQAEAQNFLEKSAIGGNYVACDYLSNQFADQDVEKAIRWHELAMRHAGFRGSADLKKLHELKLRATTRSVGIGSAKQKTNFEPPIQSSSNIGPAANVQQTGMNPELDLYIKETARRIKKAWFPPRQPHSYRITSVIRIDASGKLSDYRSPPLPGDENALNAVKRAIENASPFRRTPFNNSIEIVCVFEYGSGNRVLELVPIISQHTGA